MANELILQQAVQRGEQQGISYAGLLTPAEAWQLKSAREDVVIVDVRSAAEWQFVGVVPDALRIELRSFPGMVPNQAFVQQLQQQVASDKTVLFLCRSGARSDEAARLAAAEGYAHAYNILEGFEGDRDEAQHRGNLTGWKAAGLPWIQG